MNLLHFYTYGTQRPARPQATMDIGIDCRSLRNPAGHVTTPAECRDFVRAAPGFPALAGLAVEKILAASRSRTEKPLHIGVYCLYGRHRSPVVAQVLADMLKPLGFDSTISNL